MLDAFGRIFEARAGGIDEPVVGAHAGGYNLVSTGVAVLGSFMANPISPAARTALQRLLAWKLALHGVPSQGRVTVRVNPAGAVYSRFPANTLVPLPRIAGHRDGDSTDCPGDALYGELPGVRAAVERLAPNAVRATLALTVPTPAPAPETPPPTEGAGAQTPTPTPTLSGTLALLDGTPLPGASVQIQQRSVARRGELVQEQTLAQVSTGHDRRVVAACAARADEPSRWDRVASDLRRRGRRLRRSGGGWRDDLRAAGARDDGAHAAACSRAHASSRSRSRVVSPSAGSVRTSSVGAARAAAHS